VMVSKKCKDDSQAQSKRLEQVVEKALSRETWSPTEFMAMAASTLEELGTLPGGKEAVRLRNNRLIKHFMEEVYPLAVFARGFFGEREDVVCKPIAGDTIPDAIISDFSTSPPTKHKIEITLANHNKQTHFRMRHLNQEGWAPVTGRVERVKGPDGEERLVPKLKAHDHDYVVELGINRVTEAIRKKCKKEYEYGTWLLVYFSLNPAFRRQEGLDRLATETRDLLTDLRPSFGRVFLVAEPDTVLSVYDKGSTSAIGSSEECSSGCKLWTRNSH
jgi:hypothetical protein